MQPFEVMNADVCG